MILLIIARLRPWTLNSQGPKKENEKMIKHQPTLLGRKGIVLQFMREERKLSFPSVSIKIGIKASVIEHMEKGRNDLTQKEIDLFLQCYEFDQVVFSELLELKPFTKQAANFYFIRKKSK